MSCEVVERFLSSMTAHDWAAMSACLAEDVERTGPYGDCFNGRDEYVAFISQLMPTLAGYRMEIDRILCTDDGVHAVAELSETVEVDGVPLLTPEALVFDIAETGVISRLAVYKRRSKEAKDP